MASYSTLLSGLGWETAEQQEAVLQVMHFYGCFSESELPEPPSKLADPEQIDAWKALDTDLSSINEKMQKHLKRPAGSERAMLGDDPRLAGSPDLRAALISRYDALGMIKEITPPERENYDAILVLGSSQPSFEGRLNSLIEVIGSRHVTGTIYLLGSDRELWPIHEPIVTDFLAERTGQTAEKINKYFEDSFPEEIRTVPAELNKKRLEVIKHFTDMGVKFPTEADMMYALVDQSVLKDLLHVKVESGKRADGSRANTEDTVVKFRDIYGGVPGKVLIISTQPEALYQVEPVRKILTEARIDIAAQAAKEDVNLLVINDAIARKVYSCLERIKQQEAAVSAAGDSFWARVSVVSTGSSLER